MTPLSLAALLIAVSAASARAAGPAFAHFQHDAAKAQCAAGPESVSRDELQHVAVCVQQGPADPVPSPENMRVQNCMLSGPTPGSVKPVKIFRVADDDDAFAMVHGDMARCSVNRSLIGGANGLDGGKPLVLDPSSFKYVRLRVVARTRMSGVEDFRAKTLKDLWDFAWKTAKSYISQEDQILLVAESAKQRDQDQLYIDIVRLDGNQRDRLFELGSFKLVSGLTGTSVWDAAEDQAKSAGLTKGIEPQGDSYLATKRFGIVVARGPGGDGYAVKAAADDQNLEKSFALACPDPDVQLACGQ